MSALHHEFEDKEVLGKVKEALIQRIGSERFDLWFNRGVQFRWDGHAVVVEVASEFALQRLRTNYFRHLESAVAQARRQLTPVRVVLAEELPAAVQTVDAADAADRAETFATLRRPVATGESRAGESRAVGVAAALRANRPTLRRPSPAPTGPRQIGVIGAAAIDARSARPETGQRLAPSVLIAPSVTDAPATDAPVDAQPLSTQADPMTFANFAIGQSNQLAHTAAQMLVTQPGDAAPLCFWGATGTGKTHLLNAIRHELRTRHRLQRVILLSAEVFTNEFLTAVRGAGLPAFRNRYRDVDALLIDNIQFFGGKSATLREVLYTVDTVVSRRRPLVLAGDRPPMEIEGLSSELAGRMSSGLVCGLNPLELELRCELLRRQSEKSFLPWDEETVQAIAMRVTGDGRIIQGIGRLVSMLQRMHRRMPTMQEIMKEAGDILQRGPRSVALADIEKAVCTAFNLPEGELRSESKSRKVSQPRILAMYLARQHTSAAFSEIGRYFGDRNHSTVIAAYRRAEDWLKANQSLGGRGAQGMNVQEAIDTVENLLRIG